MDSGRSSVGSRSYPPVLANYVSKYTKREQQQQIIHLFATEFAIVSLFSCQDRYTIDEHVVALVLLLGLAERGRSLGTGRPVVHNARAGPRRRMADTAAGADLDAQGPDRLLQAGRSTAVLAGERPQPR